MRVRTVQGILLASVLIVSGVTAGEVGDAYQKVKDSVVVIEVVQQTVDPVQPAGLVRAEGIGSGVLISDAGEVMTAAHVVQIADEVKVTFRNGESAGAKVVASDPDADLALLQLDAVPAGAVAAPLGDSDTMRVGHTVLVVGNPMGIHHTVTVGHISARRTENQLFSGFTRKEIFQTDAAINQGNSGGAMFNLDGEVIGIVSYIISQGGGFEGLGFAITSNTARRVLLESAGFWSGLQGRILDEKTATLLNVPQAPALLVERVVDGSPGASLGIRGGDTLTKVAGQDLVLGGDVILEVFGVSVAEPSFEARFQEELAKMGPGDEMTVRVLRAGKVIDLSADISSSIHRPD